MQRPELPRVRRDKPSSAQYRRLASWLGAWILERRAPPEETAPPPVVKVYPEAHVEPYAGQVRLLFPCTVPARTRPMFLALLREDASGTWTCAPFSRFADPALPGELLLRTRRAGLRVLQVWNVLRLERSRPAYSWVAGRLAAQDREDALSLLEALEASRAPPESLRNRIGPTLHHPLDPRLEYQAGERACWQEALEQIPSGAYTPAAPAALPLAAEGRTPYRAGNARIPSRP